MVRRKIEAPKGMKWCSRHREFLSEESFTKGQSICKQCRKYYNAKWKEENNEQYREYQRQYHKQRRISRKFEYEHVYTEMLGGMVDRTNSKKGTYANVDGRWTSIPDARRDFQQNERLIAEFDAQYLIYAKSQNPDDVPSVHRVDPSRGYYPGNITVISWGKHKELDNCYAIDVTCWTDGTTRRIPTKKATKEQLGTLDMLDKGFAWNLEDGKVYIVQSASITDDRSRLVGNRYVGMSSDEIVASMKAKFEKSRLIVEAIKQMA